LEAGERWDEARRVTLAAADRWDEALLATLAAADRWDGSVVAVAARHEDSLLLATVGVLAAPMASVSRGDSINAARLQLDTTRAVLPRLTTCVAHRLAVAAAVGRLLDRDLPEKCRMASVTAAGTAGDRPWAWCPSVQPTNRP
jgi:hypothetical protein